MSHSPWEPARHSEPEDDRALARMLGWAFLVGLGLWIALAVALIGGAGE